MSAMGDVDEENVGHDLLSDDSSFYGDEDLRAELEDRAATFDPSHYWAIHNSEFSVIAATAKAQVSRSARAPKDPFNLYEGNSAGRQLSETVASFLSRLPPLSTRIENHGPWIYIANPHSEYRPTNEDLAGLTERGRDILKAFEAARAGIEISMAGKAKSAIGRKITPLRKQAEADIYAAAQQKGCTSGKWMLFPTPDDVNSFWSLVATATAAGELGHAAKVATYDGSGGGSSRLICVYTKDFSDKGDVKRVLERLVSMGLVNHRGGERGIYYKADAFTHLDIMSKNEWGLKASLFFSRDVLAEGSGNRKG